VPNEKLRSASGSKHTSRREGTRKLYATPEEALDSAAPALIFLFPPADRRHFCFGSLADIRSQIGDVCLRPKRTHRGKPCATLAFLVFDLGRQSSLQASEIRAFRFCWTKDGRYIPASDAHGGVRRGPWRGTSGIWTIKAGNPRTLCGHRSASLG
jgi:hypothetical protein